MKVQINSIEVHPDLWVWHRYISNTDEQAIWEAGEMLNFNLEHGEFGNIDLVLLRKCIVYDTDTCITYNVNEVIAKFEKVKSYFADREYVRFVKLL